VSYSREERLALCALLDKTGPDAPTLCAGWTTGDLAAHLVLREHRPDAAAGVLGGPLAGYTARVQRRLRTQIPFPDLVRMIRSGPPRWSFAAVPGMDERLNAVEYFVHHEDVRRAGQDWEPREISIGESAMLWHRLQMARFTLRRAPVGVELARDDMEGDGQAFRITVKNATPAVTVIGSPAELTMWTMGRTAAARVRFDGTGAAVSKLTGTNWRLARPTGRAAGLLGVHLALEPGQFVVDVLRVRHVLPGLRGRDGGRVGLDIGAGQRAVRIGLGDLALGLLARDLLTRTRHLDGDHDRPHHERGNHEGRHRVNNEPDHRADDQERDEYPARDGGDLQPAHPPHPLSTRPPETST
jgi:uncharacterized protein (TIGR03085 family)